MVNLYWRVKKLKARNFNFVLIRKLILVTEALSPLMYWIELFFQSNYYVVYWTLNDIKIIYEKTLKARTNNVFIVSPPGFNLKTYANDDDDE